MIPKYQKPISFVPRMTKLVPDFNFTKILTVIEDYWVMTRIDGETAVIPRKKMAKNFTFRFRVRAQESVFFFGKSLHGLTVGLCLSLTALACCIRGLDNYRAKLIVGLPPRLTSSELFPPKANILQTKCPGKKGIFCYNNSIFSPF